MGNKLEDFFKNNPEDIKKNIEDEKRSKELKSFGYKESGEVIDENKINYDPINKKTYSVGKENFLIENAETYSEEEIGEYIDYLGSNYDKKQEKLDHNEKDLEEDSFEKVDILNYWKEKITEEKEEENQNIPEYSEQEKDFLSKAAKEWFNKKRIKMADESEISKKENPEYEARVIEMLKEFRDLFPEDYIKTINKKVVSKELANFDWEEEEFGKRKNMASYYPNKKEATIKFINTDNKFKNLDKVFVTSSVNKKNKIIKDKNGRVLVFCEAPSWYKTKKTKA
jgi:hypothetical protein